jgi:hypothetical protein
MGGACNTYGERKGKYKMLVLKREGKKLLGRRRHRSEDNIKMNPKEIVWGAWTELIWLRIWTICALL